MNLTDFFQCYSDTNQKFILSCSGGSDSQVMLHLALRYLDHRNLSVVYFNHKKRLDVAYDISAIRSLLFATKLKLQIVDVNLDSPMAHNSRYLQTPIWDLNDVVSNKSLNNFQALSSNFRYSYLLKLAKQTDSKVLLAQHSDDQNENLLMKLAADSSIFGFSPLSSSQYFLRPFVNFSKSELLEYLTHCSILHNEDSSNLSLKYTRNKFRYYLDTAQFSDLFLNSLFEQCLLNKKIVQESLSQVLNIFTYELGFYVIQTKNITSKNLLYIFWIIFAEVSRGRFIEFKKFVQTSKVSSEFSFNSVRVFKTKNALFITKNTNQEILTDFGFLKLEKSYFATSKMQFEFEDKPISYKKLFRKLNIPVFLRTFVPVVQTEKGLYKLYSKSLILSVYKNFIKMA